MKFLLILALGLTFIQVYAKNALTLLRSSKHKNGISKERNQDKQAGKV